MPGGKQMLDEKDLILALKRHWDYSGMDEDVSHEIYHDDAVLEFPQSGERFEGVENFREWSSARALTNRSLSIGASPPLYGVTGRPSSCSRYDSSTNSGERR
jgi:hypothetical protein